MQEPSDITTTQKVYVREIKRYNSLVSDCFKLCVRSMSSKKLDPSEERCLGLCYKKTNSYNDRFTTASNDLNSQRIGYN